MSVFFQLYNLEQLNKQTIKQVRIKGKTETKGFFTKHISLEHILEVLLLATSQRVI